MEKMRDIINLLESVDPRDMTTEQKAALNHAINDPKKYFQHVILPFHGTKIELDLERIFDEMSGNFRTIRELITKYQGLK